MINLGIVLEGNLSVEVRYKLRHDIFQILQYPVSAKRPLHMHMKGDSTILATVTMTNLTRYMHYKLL
jgi:hypothetical protein